MGTIRPGVRAAVVVAVGALALAACGGSSGGGSSSAGGSPTKGGTIYDLDHNEEYTNVDPQRVYTGEDLAYFAATLFRTLTAFKYSSDTAQATTLVPDMATDTGTATDGAKTWAFTIRDGVTFETGAPVTCADIKYGVSRTFATDVITGGPTYAIQDLDIPTNKDGSSAYAGPYKKTGQDLFDKAVTCSSDNKTITFHLNKPVPDWNYAMTLTAFSPVPAAADTGAKYDDHPVSSGPYKIQTYTKGKGGKLILVRNDKWSQASDPYRQAYPDTWETDFGLDNTIIDQRMIQDSGNDQMAITTTNVQPQSLPVVFNDPKYASRRVNDLTIYADYMGIDTQKVPNEKIRQAIGVALNRDAMRTAEGGTYTGDFSDGVIPPAAGKDYAPSGLWDGLLGQKVPTTGDAAFAKQLIAQSGVAAPTLTYDYPNSAVHAKVAAIVQQSLQAAGFTINLNPIESGQFYTVMFDPKKAHELMGELGWGQDWPNASTIIPQLFASSGGWNLSRYNNKAFDAASAAAQVETDRDKQATDWQNLNKQAMQTMAVVPTWTQREQRLSGSKIGGSYAPKLWAPYSSWPYALLYVKQ
jgi:peptide/nickel transport system substrate-binding protein